MARGVWDVPPPFPSSLHHMPGMKPPEQGFIGDIEL